jgi:hypothetical protein
LKRPRRFAFLPLILVVTRIDAFASLEGPDLRRSNLGKYQRLLNTPRSDNQEARHLSENVTKPSQRHRQRRRKPVVRRPRYFWLDRTNLCHELYHFWSSLGISTDPSHPAIPNERLLMHFGRHDLRAAIVKNGGRTAVSQLLNGAPILPGRWKTAVRNSPELQQLILNNHTGLSPERPPSVDTTSSSSSIELQSVPKLWSHQNGRNRKGHWSLQMVIQEL